MKFRKTTLPNGLRVITVAVKDHPSVAVTVFVETGSNYESKEENGLSHFLEHMCFKGTSKRPNSMLISGEFENFGAANNAFTTGEFTGYWAKAPNKHFSHILEMISDMYLDPLLLPKDIKKEKEVILQEISMYEDLPQSKVWDVLDKLVYGETAIGRPVSGTKGNVKKFNQKDFQSYRERHYVANKTIVVVAGGVDGKQVIKEVKKRFSMIRVGKKQSKTYSPIKQRSPNLKIFKKKTDQTHMVLGLRGYVAKDKRLAAQEVLTTVLGRGMSSRLFQKVREEMGACYYIKARTSAVSDHGLFSIATGIKAERAPEVLRVILSEMNRLKLELVPPEELKKAKEYMVGHLYMGLETADALADFAGEQEIILEGKLLTPKEVEKEIREVTAEDIRKVARDIFRNSNLNLAIIGNVSAGQTIKKALRF